ncbi:MAG: 30S ribosomal protein S15 [Candidatus Omnitrophica bacterium]|nr:30S ribosomal protein S15 [Candidatus Omnitrophota bacterium]MDD5236816.1 30S ribosomal protein S15 [Candidatus Omnitrophota bacterium]MDD5611077.1 30S ribosomal protein S15 [Candidatus Omnitrophota bacterium]
MVLEGTHKTTIIEEFKLHKGDTGSADVQIALLTERINLLTDHFKQHKKDFHSRRGLLAMVGKRKKLIAYLKKKDIKKYEALIKKLKIRK